MPPIAANDNNPRRPDGFDAALVAHMPTLRRYARKLAGSKGDSEDILHDGLNDILRRASTCRMETFKVWANIVLLGSYRSALKAGRRQMRNAPTVSLDDDDSSADFLVRGLPASQDSYADLSAALAVITGRNGDILIRRAMGDTPAEIGLDYGLTKERVRQVEKMERSRVAAALGVAA